MSGLRFVAFPDRPCAPPRQGTPGISRFPCKELPHMLRVSDCAGPSAGSRFAPAPVLPSASLNNVGTLEALDFAAQYLACGFPCQRFAATSQLPTHDSGPGWER